MSITKASKPVTIDADLYNDVLSHFWNTHPTTNENSPMGRLTARLQAVVEGDMCMDDGDYPGDCSAHDDRIEYWVDNFGPEGKVIALGIYPPAVDICFPVCPGAQAYDERLAR
jgi:hypothetical protein